MKKFLSIILSILMVVTMLPMAVLPASAATPTPYDGVPVTPQKISSSNYAKLGLTSSNWSQFNGYYAIRNAKELYGFAAVSRNSYTANAVLLQDIVVNANGSTTYDWTPIISSNPGYIYESIFDGNGHYISGLYSTVAIAASGGNNAKFSGFICRLGGTAKNLVIKNSTFAPGEDISTYGGVGAITGYPVSCTIQNCRVENITLKSINDGGQLGGIAGYGNGNSSTIKNCVSINVTFSGGIYTNSIAPKAPYSNCYTSATASHNCTNLSVEHKEVKATCEYPGLSNYKYCLVCGKVTSGTKTETPATGHTLKSATCIAPKTCTICGATEGSIDNTAHSWANNDGICANGCGATCAHKNQTGSACEICGAELHVCSNYNNGFCTECDAYEPAELKDGYYQIENGGNLFWYANYINTVDRTANAVLTADIDLENRPWTPIGSTGENSNNFRGIFDGQNYTIRGLYAEGGRAGLGFFGEVRTGTVKNFTIYGEVVVNTEVDYVGGVIGSVCGVNGENDLERNGAIIQNINSYVNLTAKAHGVGKIGGFVGYANHESLIENCAWYGTFDAGKYRVDNGAGGFIGRIQENSSEVTIRNCGAYGTIKTNYAGDYNDTATIYMGGFLSFSNTNAQTTLENCLFAGKFERGENLTDEALLGAFGTLRSVKAIKNCYYLGDDGLEAVHSDSSLKPGSDNVEITKVTGEELKSGKIANQLGEYWEQVEDYPRPKDTGSHSHSYTYTDNGDGTHDMVCTGCDYVEVDNEAHSGGTATCTEQAKCERCGTSYGELDPDNHDFGSGNTCICGAEIAFTGIVVDDENSDEYRYDETRKTYTIIIPADEVGGIGYLSYDIIGTNLTLIEDTNTLLKVQHENEDGLTPAPDDLLVDVLQDNGCFGWSVLGYGDGEWEKLLYSNDGGMTWTTYTFEVKQAYSITVNASQNGTVTANEYAIEGDNIALNVSPAEGYMLDTLSVTDASGNSVDVENNAFTMPASAVTVTATFAVCDHKDGRHETATDNGDGTHDATYSCCGATVTEGHTGGEATCTDKAVCDLCGASYGELDWTNHEGEYVTVWFNDYQHVSEYECCHIGSSVVYEDHKYENYTVTTPADCVNNAWEMGECICGDIHIREIAGSATDHNWSNKDGICANGCGAECPHDSYTYSVCDKCGYECPHEWDEGVLTRPVYDAVLGSKDGYYTYTCTVCGEEKTEVVKSADYSAYEAVSEEINALLQSDDLTSEAKQAIYSAANECGLLSNDLTESEQNKVDSLVAELEKIVADAEEKIASGEYVKADYTEIDEAIDDIEEKLASENVTDEGKAELEEIKKQLEEMKADENTSEADLPELEKALEDYEAELDKGIEDGTLVKVDGFAIAAEATEKWKERLEAEGLTDEYEDFINNQKATDEALAAEKEINDFLNSLEGTVAENAENIAKLNEMLDSLLESWENCLRGTHNFKDYEVTSPAKCEVNAIETSTCWFCGETDEREVEGTALSHSFTKYEVTEKAECGKAGKEVAVCDYGCGETDERETPALEHSFLDYVSNGDATCTADGTKTASCIHGCGATDTVADEGSMIDHTDEDGDKLCDDCQAEIADVCPDCGRPVHEDSGISRYICILIMLIRLVISFFKAI